MAVDYLDKSLTFGTLSNKKADPKRDKAIKWQQSSTKLGGDAVPVVTFLLIELLAVAKTVAPDVMLASLQLLWL